MIMKGRFMKFFTRVIFMLKILSIKGNGVTIE